MIEAKAEILEEDYIGKVIELCRSVKDKEVFKIILGKNLFYSNPPKALKKLETDLRQDASQRERLYNCIVNLAFAYITSKFVSLNFQPTSNCESRIKLSAEHLYSTYDLTDDAIKYIMLNVALGLDANIAFRDKFSAIGSKDSFYKQTDEYIGIFKHIQKLKQSDTKTKENIPDSGENLYKLFKKVSFICDLQIADGTDYTDPESKIRPCRFIIGDKSYDAKYMLVRYFPEGTSGKYLLLRSIDDTGKDGEGVLKLNFTGIDEHDNRIQTSITVTEEFTEGNRDSFVVTDSLGKFYSYITGDLLRKRHRMSFCNGFDSYKYYGELAASVMDALEMQITNDDKQCTAVEKYILPVIVNNFNICQEECVCMGVGCKFGINEKQCGRDKVIRVKENFKPECAINMDIVSILTILFSVVGCKDILPQIFARVSFDKPTDYSDLFKKVNDQLRKRFAGFDSEKVEELRRNIYNTSISYLSFDLKNADTRVTQTLKPLIIRAYTDSLIACLENLDRKDAICVANPSENVYGIQNKIDLIKSMSPAVDVRAALRDTVKIILTYYAGLAHCTQQQLNFEIKAEQMTVLDKETVGQCEKDIYDAFMDGVDMKLKEIGSGASFCHLFRIMFDDAKNQKSDISLMLGREMVNISSLDEYIQFDGGKCYLVIKNDGNRTTYSWDLDDEKDCRVNESEFNARVVELLNFFKGEDNSGSKFACYPKVLTHTSSRVNVDKTTISSFTVYESERYIPQKEYNVITYFSYEISKRYFYVAPKKFEKTRWITYPILIRCSELYSRVIKGEVK
ncbi:MAG: hypothetical protein K2H30_02445 [Clostridia bacterium]|nr:hypothetical protein [Clostridia bacterium]